MVDTTKKQITKKQKAESKPTPKAGGSIATKPAKQILNTNKREMDQATGNTPLKTATCGSANDAVPYDDILEAGGTKVSNPHEFQTTVDKSDRVPAWNAMAVSQDSPDAITRTNMPIYHEGHRKEPMKMVHSTDNHKAISQGGVLDEDSFKPSYAQSGFGSYGGAPQQAGKHTTPGKPDTSKVS
jgi:hypothetical protein